MAAAPARQTAHLAESDRFREFPHPREAVNLFGHRQAEAEFLAACRSGRMHHAWLIEGQEGIGKATLAYRIARFVLAHADLGAPEVAGAVDLAVDPASETARHVAAGADPGLVVMTRTLADDGKRLRVSLTIDEVRKGLHFFAMTALAGGWRVAIVDAADELNVNAANALLKSLEEPPERSLWLIVSHVPGRLPATLRSRCRRLRLNPLGEDDLEAAVRQAGAGKALESLAPDQRRQLGEAAKGSGRRALAALDGDGLARRAEIVALLDSARAGANRKFHVLADRIARPGNDEDFGMFIELAGEWLAGRVEQAGAHGDSDPARLARLAEVWEKISRLAAETETFHFNRKQVILNIFRAIGAAAA